MDFLLGLLWLLLWVPKVAESSNWAQTSGKMSQNVVFPSIPSPANRHWQARFGHAAVIGAEVDPDPEVATLGKIYIMGGDTNTGDTTKRDFSPGELDIAWNNGYKNDVWSTTGTEWMTGGDIRMTNNYRGGGKSRNQLASKQKLPRTTSMMAYDLVQPGRFPPPGVTYDDWIICEDYFSNAKYADERAAMQCDTTTSNVMWSPRRHHAAVYFDGNIYVMGGRAREYVVLPEERSVGGIIGPRVQDVPQVGENELQKFTSRREASVYKSDVWRSSDGLSWTLVTPGCKAPQYSLVAQGNEEEGKWGHADKACTSDDDCYGGESCSVDRQTCICNMWSPREQHAVAVFGDKMYVSGGYASRLYTKQTACGSYACGDTDSSAYRYYMNDVWSSSDGESWTLLTEVAWGDAPRGGHQMLVLSPGRGSTDDSPTPAEMLVIGGRGGDNDGLVDFSTYYYNDIWSTTDGQTWTRAFGGWSPEYDDTLTSPTDDELAAAVVDPGEDDDAATPSPTPAPTGAKIGTIFYDKGFGDPNTEVLDSPVGVVEEAWWAPRCGHTVSLEIATPGNLYTRTVYLIGGQGENYATDGFFEDVWVWRPDSGEDLWRKDFTKKALFATGEGETFRYAEDSPTIHYVTPDSDIIYLQRFTVPIKLNKKDARRYELREYLSDQNIADMREVGINTIRELAEAPLYTILKLRGFDFPQIELKDRMTFYTVCDKRALAQAIVAKCSVNIPKMLYAGEANQPWNIIPEWAMSLEEYENGGATGNGDWTGEPPTDLIQPVLWHGPNRKSYAFLVEKTIDDDEKMVEEWDGCTYEPAIQGLFGPNVNGLGYVDQVQEIVDPGPDLQNLQCKWSPGPRAYHAAVVFEERMYIFGGKKSETEFYADSWYRDALLPTARISDKPEDYSDYPWFIFQANEPGVSFEYRVWDPYNYEEIRPWTPVVFKHDVGWLNWRKKGPGNGLYTLYVRSVDPAGNRDELFYNDINAYTWNYVSPTPWDIIAQGVAGFIALVGLGYLEYRRRVRKAAMERYAMKRMRRKFKAMQRDIDGRAVDWRTLYMENKAQEEANKGKKKAKRAIRDKKKEARAKEKKKRDKEKEKLKKKLKDEAKAKGDKSKKGPKAKSLEDPKQKKSEKASKKKDKEDSKKMKDYEKDGEKKMKDYEKSGKDDPMEAGTKQRKANKRFKEYEEKDQEGEGTKKDV